MSHWAEVDNNNIVIRVLVGPNAVADEGYQWLLDNLGGRWIKTSINTYGGEHLLGKIPVRKNYAGYGYTYDEVRDAFIPPQPDEQIYTLNEDTCLWEVVENVTETTVPYVWDPVLRTWRLSEGSA